MGRLSYVGVRASRLVAVAVLLLAFSSTARAQGGRPFGSVYSGLGYGAQWGYNWYGNDYDAPYRYQNPTGYTYAPARRAQPTPSAPYFTGQYHEPGDGYRYPLYYNPSTGTYLYYPVRR